MTTKRYATLLIAGAAASLATLSNAAVSDESVRKWIASALEGSAAGGDSKAKLVLAKARKRSDSFAAWTKLKECRDDGNSLDLDLASAEHYLFIRSFAADKGERDIEALPKLYGEVKDKLGPAAQLLKTSDQPVSAPDPAVVRWGERGVTAGLSDYKAESQNDTKPKTGQYKQFKLALEGYYANYSQNVKNPSCKVKP